MSATAVRMRALTAIAIAALLLGCGGGQGDAASPATTPSAAPPPTLAATPEPIASEPGPSEPVATEVAAPVRTSEPLGNLEVSYLPPDPVRFRRDTGIQGAAQHWLPLNVVEDDRAERWGDWFLFVPTVAHNTKTGAEASLPKDPVGWLLDHPDVKVLEQRRMKVDGRPATLLDVKRGGSLLLGGEGFRAPDGDGFERFVLWRVRGTWVAAQASTFGGRAALAQKDTATDPFMSYLAKLHFE